MDERRFPGEENFPEHTNLPEEESIPLTFSPPTDTPEEETPVSEQQAEEDAPLMPQPETDTAAPDRNDEPAWQAFPPQPQEEGAEDIPALPAEPDADKNITLIDDRFIRVIPDNFKEDYKAAKRNLPADMENLDGEKLYLRFLMVTDFISGMTDSYARNLYQISNGLN